MDPADILLMEPRGTFDRCVVGLIERFSDRFVVYDRECVLNAIAEGMDVEEGEDAGTLAEEFYSFNVLGAWLGDGTPGFGTPWTPEP